MRAVFAVDGGNATGVAWAVYDEKARSVQAALDNAVVRSFTLNHQARSNKARIYVDTLTDTQGNFPYTDMLQVVTIYNEFRGWKRTLHEDGVPLDNIELLLEDFTLLPGPHAGGKDGVASVRIAWGIVGMQLGISQEWAMRHRNRHVSPIIWQEPSVMGTVSDQRLKDLGVWTAGREHERSAMKHLVVRIGKTIGK